MDLTRAPLGMNNRAADHALPEGVVRNIVNCDVTGSGRTRRRKGFARVYSGMSLHSGFSCPGGAFYVEAGVLRARVDDSVLISGIRGPVAYYYFNGTVYLSDGSRNWTITDGVAAPWVKPTTASGFESYAGVQSHVDIYDLAYTSGPPPGHIIRVYAGRIYIATVDGVIEYSEPFDFNHFKKNEGYLVLPGDTTLMEPIDSGIFFATAKETWFYAGNPDEGFQVVDKLRYGAIKGTSVQREDGSVMWQSTRGLVVGTPDGMCSNVQEGNVATGSGASGAALLREEDGLKQFIAVLNQPTASTLAATSWIDAEVIRRGE